MKNKILITFFVILGLFLINIFSINSFYNNFEGKKLYENKDFSGSLNFFKKNKNYIGLYNLGNVNYKLGEKIKTPNPLSGAKTEKIINFWKKSLDFYKNSMEINYTKQAEENYNFVKNKLEELKKKQEDKKKNQEQKQENKNQENSKKGEEKKLPVPKEKKGSSGTGTKENKPQLSSQAKQQIKAYEEKLKQEQKRNAKNFGKVYQEQNNPFDDFDEFFNNSLFDNSILDKGEKKDW